MELGTDQFDCLSAQVLFTVELLTRVYYHPPTPIYKNHWFRDNFPAKILITKGELVKSSGIRT
jgi:hypothetical protein